MQNGEGKVELVERLCPHQLIIVVLGIALLTSQKEGGT